MGYHEHKRFIHACMTCAAVCNHCASECTKEVDAHMMARCIELTRACAEICYTAGRLMSMGSSYARAMCKLCSDVCTECAAECGRYNNEHCRECAEECSACAAECSAMCMN